MVDIIYTENNSNNNNNNNNNNIIKNNNNTVKGLNPGVISREFDQPLEIIIIIIIIFLIKSYLQLIRLNNNS